MKKYILIMLLIGTMLLCYGCADIENSMQNQGGFIAKNGDYVIVNSSGGIIQDVWKLRDCLVSSPDGSDGWYFTDNAGNSISLGGDVKVIRVYDSETWNLYHEYHYEFESVSYQDKFPVE